MDNILSSRKNSENTSLIKSLQDRVSFLEHELEFKNDLIRILSTTEKSSTYPSREDFNVIKASNFVKDITQNSDNDILITKNSPPQSTPEKDSVITQTTNINKQALESQLAQVRQQFKVNFNLLKLSTKKDTSKNQQEKTSTKGDHIPRKNVVLCGDSIINGIDGLGLSSKEYKTLVRPFPGSTSKDLIKFVQPLIDGKNVEELIIHIGTNDL